MQPGLARPTHPGVVFADDVVFFAPPRRGMMVQTLKQLQCQTYKVLENIPPGLARPTHPGVVFADDVVFFPLPGEE